VEKNLSRVVTRPAPGWLCHVWSRAPRPAGCVLQAGRAAQVILVCRLAGGMTSIPVMASELSAANKSVVTSAADAADVSTSTPAPRMACHAVPLMLGIAIPNPVVLEACKRGGETWLCGATAQEVVCFFISFTWAVSCGRSSQLGVECDDTRWKAHLEPNPYNIPEQGFSDYHGDGAASVSHQAAATLMLSFDEARIKRAHAAYFKWRAEEQQSELSNDDLVAHTLSKIRLNGIKKRTDVAPLVLLCYAISSLIRQAQTSILEVAGPDYWTADHLPQLEKLHFLRQGFKNGSEFGFHVDVHVADLDFTITALLTPLDEVVSGLWTADDVYPRFHPYGTHGLLALGFWGPRHPHSTALTFNRSVPGAQVFKVSFFWQHMQASLVSALQSAMKAGITLRSTMRDVALCSREPVSTYFRIVSNDDDELLCVSGFERARESQLVARARVVWPRGPECDAVFDICILHCTASELDGRHMLHALVDQLLTWSERHDFGEAVRPTSFRVSDAWLPGIYLPIDDERQQFANDLCRSRLTVRKLNEPDTSNDAAIAAALGQAEKDVRAGAAKRSKRAKQVEAGAGAAKRAKQAEAAESAKPSKPAKPAKPAKPGGVCGHCILTGCDGFKLLELLPGMFPDPDEYCGSGSCKSRLTTAGCPSRATARS
jgi:hypothetical protein